MSTRSLNSADLATFHTLDAASKAEVRRRLAAIDKVAAARPGTKNKVMTQLADPLGVTIGTLGTFCVNFRKDGIKGIIPRKKPVVVPQLSLTR